MKNTVTSTVQAAKKWQQQFQLPTTPSKGTCMTACTLHKSQRTSPSLSRLTKKETCCKVVALARHSGTRHHGWFVCLCVCKYVLNERSTPCHAKSSTARYLDSGLILGIQIDAHLSKPCLRGRPRRTPWSKCTHCSRLSTIVVSERPTAVWSIPWKSYCVVCRPCPCLSAKAWQAKASRPDWTTSSSFAVHNLFHCSL